MTATAEGAIMSAEIDARQELEDVRHALQWALTYIAEGGDYPGDGEAHEDYTGATRIAWPDNPEEWA